MTRMPSDSQEQQPQGESPYPSESHESGWQNPRNERPQISFTLPPLWAILAVVGLVVLTVVAVLVVQNINKETPATPDPTLVALQAQATQLAMVMQTQTAAAQIPQPTATAQVVVVTATSGPQVVTATSVPQAIVVTSPPTPAPQVVVVTATRPSQSGAGTIATPAISPTPSFCPPAKDQTFFEPTTITITGLAIVHPWWNNGRPSWGQEQVRVLLRSGERLSFIEMLGKVYMYENIEACNRIMDREFANANFPIKTAQDLIAEGVATQQ